MSAISQDIREAGFISQNPVLCTNLTHVGARRSRRNELDQSLIRLVHRTSKGVAVPSSSEGEDERFVGRVGVGHELHAV